MLLHIVRTTSLHEEFNYTMFADVLDFQLNTTSLVSKYNLSKDNCAFKSVSTPADPSGY